ncbi:MAG: hypothetical protein EOO05_01860 [Chitinophagaceae bacterium]|nr:MAG: hypothetical protein EOO05_01860 [Chitinophagaceae bacterium]
MTKNEKILAGIGALALTGLLIFSVRRAQAKKRLKDISDEGYETAHDVLYPKKRKSYKTHYGPVLPS